MPLALLPAPPFAEDAPAPDGCDLGPALRALRSALGDRYGSVAIETIRLRDDATWSDIESFYHRSLTAAGLHKTAAPPPAPSLRRVALWERQWLLGHDDGVAVALSDAAPCLVVARSSDGLPRAARLA